MSKGPGVRNMFDAIAGRYDVMNRLMTFGQDQRWRRFVVEKAEVAGTDRVLDLACGTGDIAALFKKEEPGVRVYGSDFSRNMLAEAVRRFGDAVFWQVCDANRLPFQDEVFQAVSFGYLLRNVDDPLTVLREVHRVLSRGGRVVCLDTTPPRRNLLYPFIRLYLGFFVPLLGRIVARDKAAYAYLTGSTMDFHRVEELEALFRRAGFVEVGSQTFMFGTVAVHWGVK